MKTFIAIPCYKSVDVPFFASYEFMEKVGDCGLGITDQTLVYVARNELSAQAIAGEFDYVFWLDSDMTFEPDLMKRMFDSIGDRDFLSALYFTRKNPTKPCIFDTNEATVKDGMVYSRATNYFDYPKNCIFEIAACGFGAVLMKTSMLKDVTEKMGLPFTPAFGLGEDLSFCARAKQLGYKLWCDSSIKPKHLMTTESDEALYELSRTGNGVAIEG